MSTRHASHAGSWYTDSGPKLSAQLDGWLGDVPRHIEGVGEMPEKGARVIIAPHAGYSYSGPAAAWAYASLDLSNAKRIFLLGPSHHAYIAGCALSAHTTYATPLGPLSLDRATIEKLHSQGDFEVMSDETDEDEHSLEMHLPYIHKMLSRTFPHSSDFPPLIPMLVGATNSTTETHYGALLAPYLRDPTSIFIISSDFCHWGQRFNYTYYLPSTSSSNQSSGSSTSSTSGYSLKPRAEAPRNPRICDSIGALDRLCIKAIESGSHAAFLKVSRETGNTVCGRHPIGVVMAALEVLMREDGEGGAAAETERKARFQFVRYERSSDCVSVSDSSVSYASAFAVL
ncbi:MAG: hypothetical protein M1817_000073 [Caeruleum heppii]|nr:MAG: hypothetical protein M1817_000073 [Caeruleum heppii]